METLRPLTTGELLDRSFQTYRRHFLLFAGIAAVPYTILLVVQLVWTTVTTSAARPAASMSAAITSVFVSIALIVVSIVVGAFTTAATTFGVSDLYLSKQTSVSACYRRVKGKVGKVVYASLELSLRIGVGFMLLIVPGIYFAGKYGLAVPAVVLEDIKGRKACARSSALTKGSVGRVVAIYFLTWILVMVLSVGATMLIGMVVPAVSRAAGTVAASAVQLLTSTLVNIAVTPIMAIALTLAYYDQRVRKEAFDIEAMMAMLGDANAQAASTASA